MEQEIQKLLSEFPKLKYLLRDPSFQALTEDKQRYILEMIDDARFWKDTDSSDHPSDGFKFLASTFGLHRAQKQAEDRELTGKEREEFLQPHQDLFTQYNPYSGRSSDR